MSDFSILLLWSLSVMIVAALVGYAIGVLVGGISAAFLSNYINL